MQPISIFQILQSFLPKQTETDENIPPQPSPNEKESFSASKEDIGQESGGNGVAESGAQTAFLQFIQAHDARAKRMRKP